MRNRLVVLLLLGVALVAGLLFARTMLRSVVNRQLQEARAAVPADQTLRVLTYATFVGHSGPGIEIITAFEKRCACKVELTTTADAGLLLERLKLAQTANPFDVVIGLDQLLLPRARAEFKWLPIKEDRAAWSNEPRQASDDEFSAVDWSPLTFVYRKDNQSVPATFDDILDPKYRKQWAVQDPHVSTPGLEFYRWVKRLKKDQTLPWLKKFKESAHSVSPTWAFAYGLFKKGDVRFVFSYLTSLAYHWGVDHDRTYQVLIFPEGHPVQVELAAIPGSAPSPVLAQDFIRALHTPESQKLIMEKNFMLPVLPSLTAGTVYAELPKLKTLITEATGNLDEWDQVFAH